MAGPGRAHSSQLDHSLLPCQLPPGSYQLICMHAGFLIACARSQGLSVDYASGAEVPYNFQGLSTPPPPHPRASLAPPLATYDLPTSPTSPPFRFYPPTLAQLPAVLSRLLARIFFTHGGLLLDLAHCFTPASARSWLRPFARFRCLFSVRSGSKCPCAAPVTPHTTRQPALTGSLSACTCRRLTHCQRAISHPRPAALD